MNRDEEDIKKGIKRIWIIWGAMFLSLLIYLVVCHLLEPSWVPLATHDFPIDTFINSLYGVSIVIFFLSSYIRKFILNSNSSTQLERFTQISERTKMHPAVFKYQTAVIISLALSESIGIFGVVIFLFIKDTNSLYLFIAIAAAAMIYHIPRLSEIEN